MKHTFLLEVDAPTTRRYAERRVLVAFATRQPDSCRFNLKRKAPRLTKWIDVKEKLPKPEQRVIARYKGVYDYRIVLFWKDVDGASHFGHPSEKDGRGSQPATHWMPLLK